MRGCLVGLLVVAAVVVFVGGVAFALLTPTPAGPAQFTPVPVSTAAASRFDTKIATMQGATAPTTIEISEEEATSKLVEILATEPGAPKVDNPQVAFRDGKVYLSGVSRDTPIALNFLITGHIEVISGKPKVVVEKVEAGKLPVTGAIQSQVDALVAEQDRLVGDLPITVTTAEVREGKLVVTGQPK